MSMIADFGRNAVNFGYRALGYVIRKTKTHGRILTGFLAAATLTSPAGAQAAQIDLSLLSDTSDRTVITVTNHSRQTQSVLRMDKGYRTPQGVFETFVEDKRVNYDYLIDPKTGRVEIIQTSADGSDGHAALIDLKKFNNGQYRADAENEISEALRKYEAFKGQLFAVNQSSVPHYKALEGGDYRTEQSGIQVERVRANEDKPTIKIVNTGLPAPLNNHKFTFPDAFSTDANIFPGGDIEGTVTKTLKVLHERYLNMGCFKDPSDPYFHKLENYLEAAYLLTAYEAAKQSWGGQFPRGEHPLETGLISYKLPNPSGANRSTIGTLVDLVVGGYLKVVKVNGHVQWADPYYQDLRAEQKIDYSIDVLGNHFRNQLNEAESKLSPNAFLAATTSAPGAKAGFMGGGAAVPPRTGGVNAATPPVSGKAPAGSQGGGGVMPGATDLKKSSNQKWKVESQPDRNNGSLFPSTYWDLTK